MQLFPSIWKQISAPFSFHIIFTYIASLLLKSRVLRYFQSAWARYSHPWASILLLALSIYEVQRYNVCTPFHPLSTMYLHPSLPMLFIAVFNLLYPVLGSVYPECLPTFYLSPILFLANRHHLFACFLFAIKLYLVRRPGDLGSFENCFGQSLPNLKINPYSQNCIAY